MKRRYSGDDRHFGPFTLSKHSGECYRPIGIHLNSGGESDGCHLRLSAFGYTLILELPQIIQKYKVKHMAVSWDAATIERLGRDYYFETFRREYGFSFSDGNLHLHYGPQTWDSRTTKSKCYFLPWRHWRYIRQSWYDTNGEHITTLWETNSREVRRAQSDWHWEFEKTLEKVLFLIKDSDGEEIEASTNIEEREWRFGTGAFSWLSIFRKPRVQRTLKIEFNKEVGRDKGSWKGGLIGTSIEMLPGELHEGAFRRYCDQEHRAKHGKYRVTYIGKLERS